MFTAEVLSHEWEVITGEREGEAISTRRYYHLYALSSMDEKMFVSLFDRNRDSWTKWQSLRDFGDSVRYAFDVHRSIIDCEVVAESDYDTYEENREAAVLLGTIIEDKGFTPMYYFSGSKSIHIHILFDWKCLLDTDLFLQKKVRARFEKRKEFKGEFIAWLRLQCSTLWGVKARKFDEQVAGAKHLIRAELSFNKIGFKTFLGYRASEIPLVPDVRDFVNKRSPRLGELVLSKPHGAQELLVDFLSSIEKKDRNYNDRLSRWFVTKAPETDSKAIDFMLSDNFRNASDGFRRAAFYICSSLLQTKTSSQVEVDLLDWNHRMGDKMRDFELIYMVHRGKAYKVSQGALDSFFDSIGVGFVDGKYVFKDGKI